MEGKSEMKALYMSGSSGSNFKNILFLWATRNKERQCIQKKFPWQCQRNRFEMCRKLSLWRKILPLQYLLNTQPEYKQMKFEN